MRRKVIAGNWKMNMLPNEAMKFIDELAPYVEDTEAELFYVYHIQIYFIVYLQLKKQK